MTLLVGLAAVALSTSCARKAVTIDPQKLHAFNALPERIAPAPGKDVVRVDLGRMLYYDVRLSKGQNISCNSCHPLDQYGMDSQATSPGHGGKRGARNSPTVFNAGLQFVQFWDGRAPDVEVQAQGPVLNPIEMAMPSEAAVVAVLKSIPGYVVAFRRAFPADRNPISLKNVGEAIGAFERGLITPARWDNFLKGNPDALTDEEKAGFNAFVSNGCGSCHRGSLVGGRDFQRLGLNKEYPDTSDPGRYKVTQRETDRMYFKVPSLRNVAKTNPYFHNGAVSSLHEAVQQMAEYQGKNRIGASETNSIVAWLKTLTGDISAEYIKPPVLPQSTASTPKPQA